MIINLKQVNLTDGDNIKLDKINYNFDQLVANGGGPQGPVGSKGDTGAQGVTGAQGFQGTPGDNTTAYWKNIQGVPGSLSADTILPVHNPVTTPATPSMDYPPVITVGFVSNDTQYNSAQPVSGGNVPYQWIINRKNHFASNLRFTSSDVLNNYVDFKIENDSVNSVNRFIMKFGTPVGSSFIWYAQNHIFKSNITGNSLLSISDSSIEYNVDTEFNRPVTVKEQLIIENSGAGIDKIAVSEDTSGKITFKSIKELGGVVPYGTIISILPSIFSDNSKFITGQSITLANPNDLLNIRVGAGLGDYEGWYVCNGKTWKGTIDHDVPDLNSFSYTIGDNTNTIDPNSQGSASVTNDETHIIGGADLSMTATNVAPGVYGVGSTRATTNVSIQTTSGGSTYKIKRLPQIIYLGEGGCYWQDGGSDQAPIVLNTFYIDDLNNTASGCLTVSEPKTYAQGSSYSFTKTITVPSGYYFNSNVLVGAFTSTSTGYSVTNVTMGGGTFPSTITIEITVNSQASANTDRYITWDSSSLITIIPESTVRYSTQSWYPSMDAITNGYVYETYDLGTDPNSVGTLLTNQYITAANGSIRYIKYRIKSDDYFYKFILPSLSNFTYNNVANGSSIIEYSVTDVNGDGKTIDYIIKDTNFGSYNPGGTYNIYAYINAEATVYTDVVNGGGNGGTFTYTASGSSSLSINGAGPMFVRPGTSPIVRLKITSNSYISGGSASTFGAVSFSGNFPTVTTMPASVIAYPSSLGAVNNSMVYLSGSPTVNTGSGGSFGAAEMAIEYSSNGGSTWQQCGY